MPRIVVKTKNNAFFYFENDSLDSFKAFFDYLDFKDPGLLKNKSSEIQEDYFFNVFKNISHVGYNQFSGSCLKIKNPDVVLLYPGKEGLVYWDVEKDNVYISISPYGKTEKFFEKNNILLNSNKFKFFEFSPYSLCELWLSIVENKNVLNDAEMYLWGRSVLNLNDIEKKRTVILGVKSPKIIDLDEYEKRVFAIKSINEYNQLNKGLTVSKDINKRTKVL